MNTLDPNLFYTIHGFAGQSKMLDWLGVFLARYLLDVCAVGVAVWTILVKDRIKRLERTKLALFALAVSLFTRVILVEIVRLLFPRERPFTVLHFMPLTAPEHSFGFPSGHVSFFFAFATIIVLRITKTWWLFILGLLMGLGRVFVGVHWPTDIAGGVFLGVIAALLADKYLWGLFGSFWQFKIQPKLDTLKFFS